MITGPTVAPIGDLTDSAGPTAGTISVELEEMPAIADGLDTVSRTCADRTMPILGIAAETRLFLGINGRAQQAAGLCTGLAADLGMSAAKFGATAAAVRAAPQLLPADRKYRRRLVRLHGHRKGRQATRRTQHPRPPARTHRRRTRRS